ncbi:PREDICTED: uncharacterized protein LOC108548035 [Eufriesea mexicana]|uniref:uncharacterized protein LOC108548035 n=1 Tax=Eufriesea mexicana TaxID=516756 RepID=UPI00083BFD61|nr:PREDICTED: uncharacterized protein LOC108548035 [Eufriesea mexicana]
MKNKCSKIFLFYVVLDTATLIVATDVTTRIREGIQNSLSVLHQGDLPVVLKSLQFLPISLESKDSPRIEDEAAEKKPNITDNLKNLSKRQAVNSMVGENCESHLQSNASLIEKLKNYSCETEALNYGHEHLVDTIVHEFFCELNKLFHFILIAKQNLKTKSPLTQLFNITEDAISFTEFTFSETLPEVVETSIVHFEEFLQNPENMKGLIDEIQKSISILTPIIKCVNKLSAPIKKFFNHTEKLFGYLKSDYSYLDIMKKFEEEISQLNKAILSLFYGYVLNPVEETTNLFSEAMTQIESVFDNFTTYIQGKWFRYLAVLEEGIDILLSFYNGYFASEFSQTLVTMFSTNKFFEQYSLSEKSSTNIQTTLTLDENN